MKLIAVLTAVMALPLLASGALASSPNETDDVTRIGEQPQNYVAAVLPTVVASTPALPIRVPAVVKFRPPPAKAP